MASKWLHTEASWSQVENPGEGTENLLESWNHGSREGTVTIREAAQLPVYWKQPCLLVEEYTLGKENPSTNCKGGKTAVMAHLGGETPQ